jgi:pyruvate/2-oxoglutarate dehydrogenase complex dihydrolipoamide dehydrogenase (E3) component
MAEEPAVPVEVDVVVVGLGPGGEFAANKLARAGLDVVAVDEHLVGGECPYYGCVPSKLMVRGADALAESRRLPEVGGHAEPVPDWSVVAARVRGDHGTHGWDDSESVDRLEESGARVVRGHGELLAEDRVQVADQVFHARRGVILATGTSPGTPPIPGLPDTPYWTNRDAVQVTDLPASLVVVGAGPIGCELAQVFARYGVEVTLLEMADRILTVEEPETSELMAGVLARDGIRVMPGVEIEEVAYADGRFRVILANEEIGADKLLVAAGRDLNLDGLGLEKVGVETDGRAVDVDERMHVKDHDGQVLEKLFAIGDIVDRGKFTHVAKYQAGIALRAILDQEGDAADYRAVPRVTFTDPEIGSVGLTEQQARDEGWDVRVGVVDLARSSRGALHGAGNAGLVKLVAVDDRLVGGTVVGPSGGEVMAMLTTAIHGRVPVTALRSMIYAYPTFHGAVRNAVSALGDPG